MAVIGTYSPGGPGGSASSNEYSTIDELLEKIPDNTAHLIQAKDVRDSVYTLWERYSYLQVIASQSASASVLYTNLNPTPQTIGGITSGSTFSSYTMQHMWDMLLYPYITPSCSISASNNIREYGAPTTLSLNWSVTKGSGLIVPGTFSILVDNELLTPTGGNQTGVISTHTAVQNDSSHLYRIYATDDSNATINSYTSISWLNGVYWGKTSSIPTNMVCNSLTGKPIWADGASASRSGSGKSLSSTLYGVYDGINGAGEYLIFAWPSTFIGSGPGGNPKFTVNGLENNSWTKISVNYINMYNYQSGLGGVSYSIWISNTAQNAPITTFVIS